MKRKVKKQVKVRIVKNNSATALVCHLAGVAAKGKAMVEVVLSSEDPASIRFTASRKVTVR